jgi:ABC-type transport system substrate-binding protein
MRAPDWRRGRARRGSRCRRVGASVTSAVLAATIAGGCGGQPATPPAATLPATNVPASPLASTAPPTSASTATAAPAHADTLRVGWAPGKALDGFRGPTFTSAAPSINFGSVVYSGLYRYDARFNAVPDLADGHCVPQGDGTVIRCRIVETTFHDGTPLTADDVAYTFRLFQRMGGLGGLTEARVVDARTVDFVLSAVDPTFLTTVLPTTPIFSRRDVEAAYADFAARTADLTPQSLRDLLDTIGRELGRDPPVCSASLERVDALLAKLGARIYREDYRQLNGMLDPCAYLAAASDQLSFAADALGSEGLDAVLSAVLGFLPPFRRLVGTGPYRFVSESADRVHLEAFAGYHGGLAATRHLDFVPARADGSDLEAGTLDIYQWADLGSGFRSLAAGHGVRIVTSPGTSFFALTFNVRSGRLFADVALRRALQLCLDLPRDVDAATGGTGTPIFSPVFPSSWAVDPHLPAPVRDVGAARRLIEGAGWHLGADGTYAKSGGRLAARILVRSDDAARVKMADLIAFQARDCGMALETSPRAWADLSAMIRRYPHDIPGAGTPFDLVIMGWVNPGPDPANALATYVSSAITDSAHSNENGDHPNLGGFSDPTFDQLVAAGQVTYEQDERTRIYLQAQEELVSRQPAIFLWATSSYDALRSAVATGDGPLDLEPPDWAWQPERMVVESGT